MEMLQGVWKQHLRPRAVVGYGVKIFLPSPQNYVTRSPGVIEWLCSYLDERCQRVLINTTQSSSFKLNSGVPQGSCLGPLLFTVYASKLFDVVNITYQRYIAMRTVHNSMSRLVLMMRLVKTKLLQPCKVVLMTSDCG